MVYDLAVIGIDSLDPYVIMQHRSDLPNFSKLLENNENYISESVFPVDSIPAWASIYTGLNPSNHGFLYVYDVFDPHLSDLKKLNTDFFQGRTFWDYAGDENYRTLVIFPLLMYPPWANNGIMVSKSPFDTRISDLQTISDVRVCPEKAQEKYQIPQEIKSIWGGYPGSGNLLEWANFGKITLEEEYELAKRLLTSEKWDLSFVYFSLLDIIQHRLWRFYDKKDPMYSGNSELENIIFDYYLKFDDIIGDFIDTYPQTSLMVLSDHGHKSRPLKTVNINHVLLKKGYLSTNQKKWDIIGDIKRIVLYLTNILDLEHWMIKLVALNPKITQVGKMIYSSSGSMNKEISKAYLSTFAGIKSYSFGGIDINCETISSNEYENIRNEIIGHLYNVKTAEGDPAIVWAKKREDLDHGTLTSEVYPDIVFMLKDDYGVGWDIQSGLYGTAYDHKVASGGHNKDAVFLTLNVDRDVTKGQIYLTDIAPTILDLLEIDWKRFDFDGRSIY